MGRQEHRAGRYRLDRLIGSGGQGEVWLGHDPRLGRPVAVKLLPAHIAERGRNTDRFLREAAINAKFSHPGITEVYDVGMDRGQLFLVMELLEGQDLGRVLRGHPDGLPFEQVVGLAVEVAEALAHAHGKNVVHRDIKPANLMLLDEGGVKICDFGIAKLLLEASDLTLEGTVFGTPRYMAPEQCRGDRVDRRTDVYALGCALFALLTGGPPFTPSGGAQAELLAHQHDEAPRVVSRRPETPPELDELVDWMLAKLPGDRPQDAADVAKRLRDIRSGRAPAIAERRAGFSLSIHHNEYLAPEATEVHAVVSVDQLRRTQDSAPAALVFLVGCSDELGSAGFAAVTNALGTAIERLDDQVAFAVVAGAEYASMVYPSTMRLSRATAAAKAEAYQAVQNLQPAAGAAFGRWLRYTDRLLAAHPNMPQRAILLTNMRSDAESQSEFDNTLAAVTGRFTCDARGLGIDWEVGQLRSVASALNGTLDIVSAPEPELEPELTAMIEQLRDTLVRDVALRISAVPGARIRYVKQVSPTYEDLTDQGLPAGPGVVEYLTGAWRTETRDYHIALDLDPGHFATPAVVAELSIAVLPPTGHGQELARGQVRVSRTDDPDLHVAAP